MLSFQVINDGKTLQISCDHEGIAVLLEKLAKLVRKPGHLHLRLKGDGGDLSANTPFGEPALTDVVIDFSPDY